MPPKSTKKKQPVANPLLLKVLAVKKTASGMSAAGQMGQMSTDAPPVVPTLEKGMSTLPPLIQLLTALTADAAAKLLWDVSPTAADAAMADATPEIAAKFKILCGAFDLFCVC